MEGVTAEGIRHTRNRIIQFSATNPYPKTQQKPVNKCGKGWCERLLDRSAAFASRLVPGPGAPPPATPPAPAGNASSPPSL